MGNILIFCLNHSNLHFFALTCSVHKIAQFYENLIFTFLWHTLPTYSAHPCPAFEWRRIIIPSTIYISFLFGFSVHLTFDLLKKLFVCWYVGQTVDLRNWKKFQSFCGHVLLTIKISANAFLKIYSSNYNYRGNHHS